MGLLQKAVNEQAFLKAGVLGFPGSGKTYTAAMLAIGISKRLGDNKPVAFFDTETGSDFLIPRFETEGVELLRIKSQAFTDLVTVAREAEAACAVLIVDSITHVWRELCEAYQKRRNIRRMEFQHWADVKREWAAWTTLYLNSRLHIIVAGRAGYEWDFEADDEGKKQLIKVGTKMRVEGEFGFEPSLMIEMERVRRDIDAGFDPKAGKPKHAPGSAWIHRAHILKDRTDTINGAAFDFVKLHDAYRVGDWQQTINPFSPVLDALNIGGTHLSLDITRTSEGAFDASGQSEGARRMTRVKVALEQVEATITMIWPGQDQKSKQMKITAIEGVFGTRSWTVVEKMPVDRLERGVRVLSIAEGLIGELPNPLDSLANLKDLLLLASERADAVEVTIPTGNVAEASTEAF